MKDVAREAGVSHSTVSRVLTGRVPVHTDTAKAVREAVTAVGYRAHPGIHSRNRVITVLILDFQSPYTTNLVELFDKALADANYSMILTTARGELTIPEAYVDNIIRYNLCDGLIVVLPGVNDSFLKHVDRHRLPFVHIDQPNRTLGDSVSADNTQGTRIAVEHLAALGHRRVGCITGFRNSVAADVRLKEFHKVSADLGLDVDPDLVAEGDFGQKQGYHATQKFLALSKPPTAIFAGSDLAASGSVAACRDHGLRVPEDISVIGFDNLPYSKWTRPALTTISQPFEQITKEAVDLLRRRIENPFEPAEQIVLRTELVVRESTGPVREPAS